MKEIESGSLNEKHMMAVRAATCLTFYKTLPSDALLYQSIKHLIDGMFERVHGMEMAMLKT